MTLNRSHNPVNSALAEEWNSSRFSDVKLVCQDGEQVGSHRVVLAVLSPMIREAMIQTPDVNEETVILVPEISSEVLAAFLERAYSGGGEYFILENDLLCMGFTQMPEGLDVREIKTSKKPEQEIWENEEVDNEADLDLLLLKEDEDEEGDENEDEDEDDLWHLRTKRKVPQNRKLPGKQPREYKAGKRAIVWKYYKVIDSENSECLNCAMKIRTETGSISGLTRHLKHAHPDLFQKLNEEKRNHEPVVQSETDPSTLKEMVLEYFNKVEQSEMCSCKLCKTNVSSKVQILLKHLELHHQNEYKKCKGFQIAEMTVKGEEETETEVRKPVWKYFDETDDADSNVCKLCGRAIIALNKNTSTMTKHLQIHHKDEYNEMMNTTQPHLARKRRKVSNEDKSVSKKRGPKATFDDDPKHRTCPECHKVYSCRPAMLYHKKVVHSGIRPFKCEECGMTFARVDSYRSHSHSTVRSFLCSVCGKTFARKNIRDCHERAHYGDRRYQCSYCEKRFMTSQQKRNHERVHTGEKPFQCQDCGRQFAQQHQLTTHIRIHTGEKPYSCDNCDQKFRHLSSRNNHKCEAKGDVREFVATNNDNYTGSLIQLQN